MCNMMIAVKISVSSVYVSSNERFEHSTLGVAAVSLCAELCVCHDLPL